MSFRIGSYSLLELAMGDRYQFLINLLMKVCQKSSNYSCSVEPVNELQQNEDIADKIDLEAEMILRTTKPNLQYLDRVDYHCPWNYDGVILSAFPESSKKMFWTIFNCDIWVTWLMLISTIVVTFVTILLRYFHPWWTRDACSSKKLFRSIFENLFNLAGFFLFKSIPNIPKNVKSRLAYGVWILGIFILVTWLLSDVTSNFVVTEFTLFNSIDDICKVNQRILIDGDFAVMKAFRDINHPKTKYLLNRAKELGDVFDPNDFYNVLSPSSDFIKGKASFFVVLPTFKYLFIGVDFETQGFMFISKPLSNAIECFPLSKKLPLEFMEEIKNQISRLFEMDVFDMYDLAGNYKWNKMQWEKPPKQDYKSLSLEDTRGAFLFLCIGSTIAFVCLIVEIILEIHQLGKYKTKI